MTAAEDPRTELDVLEPKIRELTLSNSIEVEVLPLKARQFFKLLRIVTRGASHLMSDIKLDGQTGEEFANQLIAVVVFAIPEAEESAFDFVRSMVRAKDSANEPELFQLLLDPELDDVVDIVTAVIQNEKEDLTGLGKRMMSLFQVAQKTGQMDTSRIPSSEGSPDPSTSSVPSTGGPTTSSVTSPSPASGSASSPSVSDVTLTSAASVPT